jgi:putative serine/threonine protein kinase
MEVYAKGKRSIVYKDGNIIIKEERKDIQAVERIRNEAKWLKILNKEGIGPNFKKRVGNKIYMEFIKGTLILEYAKKVSKKQLLKVLLDLLDQCRVMDNLKVNKYEMHKPFKHVIVRRNKPVLIDFERCKNVLYPKNVTQVCQFYANSFGTLELREKARIYKETFSEKAYEEIRKCLINTI